MPFIHKEPPCSLHSCEGCPFNGAKVSTRGPKDSPFVIVGESPGINEVIQGAPFVGQSGQMLDKIWDSLREKGYNIPEPFVTNAMQCFPPAKIKDTASLDSASKLCHSRLVDEIKAFPRKVILVLGNAAMWSVLEAWGAKITAERGKVFGSPLSEKGVVVAVHPAFLMRGSGSLPQFKSDLEKAAILLNDGEVYSANVGTYKLINTPGQLAWLLGEMEGASEIGADIETTGFNPRVDEVISLGVTKDGETTYILERELHRAQMAEGPGSMLDELLTMPETRYIWQNGKFDCGFYRHKCIQARVDEDTMLESFTLDDTKAIHDLEAICQDRLGWPNWSDALKPHIPQGGNYSHIPRPVLYKYQNFDVSGTFKAHKIMRPLVAADPKLEQLYTTMLIPASEMLLNVERNGFPVDPVAVRANDVALRTKKDGHEKIIQEWAVKQLGRKINLNSWQQLQQLLYDSLKLAPSGTGTDADILEKLPQHPVVVNLRAYRKAHKLHSTYVKPVTDHLDSKGKFVPSIVQADGCVHSTYQLHVTPTGRLASKGPNLQNIPRGDVIRAQFISRPNRVLIEVDLNQAELRSLALLSGDPELVRIYTDPTSAGLHNELRDELYGKPEDWDEAEFIKWATKFNRTSVELIREEQKMRAKNVNFGIPYGISKFGLAEQIDDTPSEAQRLLDGWAAKFPVASSFIQSCRMTPITQAVMVTAFGRKKRWQVVSRERLNDLQNQAANFPHQSIASDIVLRSCIELEPILRTHYNTDLRNLVHDSAIVECPDIPIVVHTVAQIIINKMESIPVRYGLRRVPFKAEAKKGYRWSELKGFKVDPKLVHMHHRDPWDYLTTGFAGGIPTGEDKYAPTDFRLWFKSSRQTW